MLREVTTYCRGLNFCWTIRSYSQNLQSMLIGKLPFEDTCTLSLMQLNNKYFWFENCGRSGSTMIWAWLLLVLERILLLNMCKAFQDLWILTTNNYGDDIRLLNENDTVKTEVSFTGPTSENNGPLPLTLRLEVNLYWGPPSALEPLAHMHHFPFYLLPWQKSVQ